ncbi:hypothetical protein PX701_11745 [Agromyces sp. H3Y2-19a]|uniref:hypothetical protein n=1 Tax=Agromyces chromiiresistens TaxID=3030835 RepID=UPI0023B955A0|nr:hypothetical protein [Agromyces chromiiresistens]MDF0514296.1 hypothetical protein [Agromyces chromiiresistens]
MAGKYRYDTEVVRIFYDFAESVVWFPDPVDYDESRLSSALVADLRAWGSLHETGRDEDYEWRSPDLRRQAELALRELARRLGRELGSAFEIEYDVDRATYRSPHAPTNRAAAAAFAARAAGAEW